jgi:diguanylate cyclase (GGDEF)-like protein
MDPRILSAQEIVSCLVAGERPPKGVPSPAGDQIDRLLVGLNRLAEVLCESSEPDPRLVEIQRFLVAMAEGRSPAPLMASDRGDTLDAVIAGLNMLAEELQGAMEGQLQFRSQALYDDLTSLPNRVLLKDRLEIQLARAKRDARRVAVLFLDLNGFKLINDRFGHDVGDAVLVEVADRLRRVVRDSDTVARYGGDEFVITAIASKVDDAQKIVKQIEQVLQPPFVSLARAQNVTASIGAAIFPDHASGLSELIRLADVAMYEHKRAESEMPRAGGAA